MTDFPHDFVNQKQNRQDKMLHYVHTRPDEFQTVLKFVQFHLVHMVDGVKRYIKLDIFCINNIIY